MEKGPKWFKLQSSISFLFCSTSSSFIPSIPLLLSTATAFYTICHRGIYHFYSLTTFGSLWVSFRDYPLAYRLLSHNHCSECVGCTTPHSQTKFLVLCLTSLYFFTSLIWIRIKPLHYLLLWHALSGLNPHLTLVGVMPSQQDILPQRSLRENPKIDPFFLLTARPHPLNTLNRVPPPMHWLGTSRWCLGLLYVLHSV